jgi:hypothetical protein
VVFQRRERDYLIKCIDTNDSTLEKVEINKFQLEQKTK